MPKTSHTTQWTLALGSSVAFALIAWIVALAWLSSSDPLQCAYPDAIPSGCPFEKARYSEFFMAVYWTAAIGGPLLALGAWTFLTPAGRRDRAAWAVVAGVLLLPGPWLLHDATGFLWVDAVLAEIAPSLMEPRIILVVHGFGRLALVLCTPLVLAILMFRRERWIYALGWTAVTLNVVVAMAVVLWAGVTG
ncbi:hypothetical protein [Glycomyces paridis]|uniref:DUF998 domain-containing protein n=1 Tax=Glycomyces paridis TaxID=2126555 RepID=A0A4S8PDZ2_9ACTN|nr:hypothetical protein [Glycomyces paridis]THV28597.1 hypothetical protein E9998_10755 [Glycomyces paridis]